MVLQAYGFLKSHDRQNNQQSQLLLDNRFIEYEYLPSKGTVLETGLIRIILGMEVQSSTLVPNGTAYAIGKDIQRIMSLLRDIMVEDWNEPRNNKYGLKATPSFGVGILRSHAIEKMTNIKTSILWVKNTEEHVDKDNSACFWFGIFRERVCFMY